MNGICFKCGLDKKTIKHHLRYDKADDQIVDCCQSCHKKIHIRIRKENKCPFSVAQLHHLSSNSVRRRSVQRMDFRETLIPNVVLREQICYTPSTGSLGYTACFQADHGKELRYIDCNQEKTL